MSANPTAAGTNSGLEGIVAADTRLSHVDGEAGRLVLAGLPVEVLAPTATFEETAHLFWTGNLPTASELEALHHDLAFRRTLPAACIDIIEHAAASQADPMDALRTIVSALSLDRQAPAPAEMARTIVAAMPTAIATFWRRLHDQDPIEPRADLSHVANYLYMLEGSIPPQPRVRALETYLNTVTDHGMNASTFTARVIVSTHSDLVSAIVGAIGALKGPLHGGAPGPALDMVFEIGSLENAEANIRRRLERGERLMGFGHRVYRVRDPRAEVLSRAARELAATGEQQELHELARGVESVVLRLLEESKPGRRIQTNVEYYTALLLHSVGLDKRLFTPSFALGRSIGWTAHCLEQLETGRLIRPASHYIGPTHGQWVPLASRRERPPASRPGIT